MAHPLSVRRDGHQQRFFIGDAAPQQQRVGQPEPDRTQVGAADQRQAQEFQSKRDVVRVADEAVRTAIDHGQIAGNNGPDRPRSAQAGNHAQPQCHRRQRRDPPETGDEDRGRASPPHPLQQRHRKQSEVDEGDSSKDPLTRLGRGRLTRSDHAFVAR